MFGKLILWFVIALMHCVAQAQLFPWCDLSRLDNRNFTKYFNVRENLFAGKVGPDNIRCDMFYPGGIPVKALETLSYIVYGIKGSGKSTILKCTQRKNAITLKLDNHKIKSALASFTNSLNENLRSLGQNPRQLPVSVKEYWRDIDFIHFVISVGVSTVLKASVSEKQLFEKAFQDLSPMDKINLIDLFCMYLVNQISSLDLEAFINKVLDKKLSKKVEIGPHHAYLIKVYEKIRIRPFDPNSSSLKLNVQARKFFFPEEGETVLDPATPELQLNVLLEFMRKAFRGKQLAISLDGLDEIIDIFSGNEDASAALARFVSSATSAPLATLMTANEANGELKLFWFYSFPGENLNYETLFPNLHKDKLQYLHIKSTTSNLIGYAEFLLEKMREKQSSLWACKTIPKFEEMVQLDKTKHIIEKLRNPRDMNLFMESLILELELEAQTTGFIANEEIVKRAYEKAQDAMYLSLKLNPRLSKNKKVGDEL